MRLSELLFLMHILTKSLNCPTCSSQYTSEMVEIVAVQGISLVLGLHCSGCSHSTHVGISADEILGGYEMSDIPREDPSISQDDLSLISKKVKKINGNIANLWKSK